MVARRHYKETSVRRPPIAPYAIALGILGLAVCGAVLAQKPFREWPAIEYENFPLPDDWNQKAEWTRARLRYPDIYGYPYTRN